MSRWLLWAPLGGFLLLFAVVAAGLIRPADRTVRSAMVGKPLPAFALPPLVADKPGASSATAGQGRPYLLNVFASWCVPCIAEAPQLMALRRAGVPIVGLAIRDRPQDMVRFLRRNGDPYLAIGDDRQSAVQVALGSSGVPESFVIDGHGRIALQHVGDIRADDVPDILAAMKAAQ